MTRHKDPVDQALTSMKSTRWTGGSINENLENKLMQEFHKQNVRSRNRFPQGLAAMLGIILIGGVGFAAAGGVETVKKWFVTVELIGPDGEVFTGILEPISEDGTTATMDLQLEDGTAATLVIERFEGDAEALTDTPEGSNVELRMVVEMQNEAGFTGSDGEATFQVQLEAADGAQQSQQGENKVLRRLNDFKLGQSLDQIPEALLIKPYVDVNAIWQELHIVKQYDVNGGGLTIYTTYVNDAGDVQYREVGALQGMSPDDLSVEDVTFEDDGFATLAIVGENGRPFELKVDLNGSRAEAKKNRLGKSNKANDNM